MRQGWRRWRRRRSGWPRLRGSMRTRCRWRCGSTAAMTETAQRIAEITLDERTVIRRSLEIERERAAAIADLVHANRFVPASGMAGPFRVHLATAEGRLA